MSIVTLAGRWNPFALAAFVALWGSSLFILLFSDIFFDPDVARGRLDRAFDLWLHFVPQALTVIALLCWFFMVNKSPKNRPFLMVFLAFAASAFAIFLAWGTWYSIFTPGSGLDLPIPFALAIGFVFILHMVKLSLTSTDRQRHKSELPTNV